MVVVEPVVHILAAGETALTVGVAAGRIEKHENVAVVVGGILHWKRWWRWWRWRRRATKKLLEMLVSAGSLDDRM